MKNVRRVSVPRIPLFLLVLLVTSSAAAFPLVTILRAGVAGAASQPNVDCSAAVAVNPPFGTQACGVPRVQLSWVAPASWGSAAASGTYSIYRSTTPSFDDALLLQSNLAARNFDDATGLAGV